MKKSLVILVLFIVLGALGAYFYGTGGLQGNLKNLKDAAGPVSAETNTDKNEKNDNKATSGPGYDNRVKEAEVQNEKNTPTK